MDLREIAGDDFLRTKADLENLFLLLLERRNKCFVVYEGGEFQIENLIDNGINVIMKLIQYIPQIVISQNKFSSI